MKRLFSESWTSRAYAEAKRSDKRILRRVATQSWTREEPASGRRRWKS